MSAPRILHIEAHANHSPEAFETDVRELRVFVAYTTPELTRTALTATARLYRNLGVAATLVAVHVVPFPCPLEHPDVNREHLERSLAAAVLESPLPVRARLVFARDLDTAFRSILQHRSIIVVATKKRWWRTAEEKFARRLVRDGHSVAVVHV